jgi:hypothetical protein
MTETTLFRSPGSPYVRSVRLTLDEKRVPHDFVEVPFGTWGRTSGCAAGGRRWNPATPSARRFGRSRDPRGIWAAHPAVIARG